uniref:Uncharacterized protein n=1 Tax=viral metagenome TaxID=1070528 RepID=A0A6C0CFM9_9ZZZZ
MVDKTVASRVFKPVAKTDVPRNFLGGTNFVAKLMNVRRKSRYKIDSPNLYTIWI